MSDPDLFPALDSRLASGGAAAGIDFLIAQFREAKEYGLLFEARLMKKRFELGLPLLQTDALDDAAYQAGVVEVARDTGALFLAEGNIERAWPYFRAVSEAQPVWDAIERVTPAEGQELDGLINIAFQEGVHPRKGLELILAGHGMCRALTAFGMTAVSKDREACIALLTDGIYREVRERMSGVIEREEGARPAAESLLDLMKGRDWLFGEWDYYVDTSHLLTIVPYSVEATEPGVLAQLYELCEYGRHLSAHFQNPGIPPFENQFEAYGHYVQALRRQDTETHVEYFRRKVAESDPEVTGDAPARVLVKLLVSLGLEREALDVLLEHVFEDAPYGAPVPSALQLCARSKDFARMTEIARDRGDLLSYAAASALNRSA